MRGQCVCVGAIRMTIHLSDISARMAGIGLWLEQEAGAHLSEQRHLDRQTSESAYWHSGYHQALADVLRLLTAPGERSDSAGIPNPCLMAGKGEENFLSA